MAKTRKMPKSAKSDPSYRNSGTLAHRRADDYVWCYSNVVGVNAATNDIRLSFGEIDVAWLPEEEAGIVDRVSVTIPPRVAYALLEVLANQLNEHAKLSEMADRRIQEGMRASGQAAKDRDSEDSK